MLFKNALPAKTARKLKPCAALERGERAKLLYKFADPIAKTVAGDVVYPEHLDGLTNVDLGEANRVEIAYHPKLRLFLHKVEQGRIRVFIRVLQDSAAQDWFYTVPDLRNLGGGNTPDDCFFHL